MPKINKSKIQAVVRNNKYVGAMMIGDRDAHTTFSIQPFAAVGPHTVEVPYWASQITVAFSGGGGAGGNGAGGLGSGGTGGKGGAVGVARFVVDPQVRELLLYIGGGGPRNERDERANGINGASTDVTYNGVTRAAIGGLGGTGAVVSADQNGTANSALFHSSEIIVGRMSETNLFKPGVPGVGQPVGANPPGGTPGKYGAGGGGGNGGAFGQWSPGGAGGNGYAVVWMIGRTLK